jgi:hypothetical protein
MKTLKESILSKDYDGVEMPSLGFPGGSELFKILNSIKWDGRHDGAGGYKIWLDGAHPYVYTQIARILKKYAKAGKRRDENDVIRLVYDNGYSRVSDQTRGLNLNIKLEFYNPETRSNRAISIESHWDLSIALWTIPSNFRPNPVKGYLPLEVWQLFEFFIKLNCK